MILMSEEDPTLYIAKFEPVASSAIQANYYRILGQSSLPFNIMDITKFIEAEVSGHGIFNGSMKIVYDGTFLRVIRWEDIRVGEGLTFNMLVWGLKAGKNSVFSRVGFWRMYILSLLLRS